MRKFNLFFLSLITFLISCTQDNQKLPTKEFNFDSVKSEIIKNSKLWNKGLKTKDASVFLELYDENAHYLPDDDQAIHGNRAIADYWGKSWDFVKELHLNLETLEGNENQLYETGNGSIMIMNEKGTYDTFKYKYVNVWKKQKDGSYKVVIDIFNDVKK